MHNMSENCTCALEPPRIPVSLVSLQGMRAHFPFIDCAPQHVYLLANSTLNSSIVPVGLNGCRITWHSMRT